MACSLSPFAKTFTACHPEATARDESRKPCSTVDSGLTADYRDGNCVVSWLKPEIVLGFHPSNSQLGVPAGKTNRKDAIPMSTQLPAGQLRSSAFSRVWRCVQSCLYSPDSALLWWKMNLPPSLLPQDGMKCLQNHARHVCFIPCQAGAFPQNTANDRFLSNPGP